MSQQLSLFECEPATVPRGQFPYLDLLSDHLSEASFLTHIPDKHGFIQLIDDMGYDFSVSVHGDRPMLGILRGLGVDIGRDIHSI